MKISSPKIFFDDRLLAVEELFKQRQYQQAADEVSSLRETEFEKTSHELGLFYLLCAEAEFFKSNYKKSISCGLRSAKLLADLPLNIRYGRVQLILSKSYSAIGDLKNAEIRARDALSSYRRANIDLGQADSLNELARISFIRCNYAQVVTYLEDALALTRNDQRKTAQLTGNLARIRIHTGQWQQAEEELTETIAFNKKSDQEISLALNLLSLGYLQIRLRKFIMASRSLDSALEIISRLNLKREKVIYLEYAGELAFEKGDYFRAKSILANAYEKGLLMAPGSALISQSARRLAEVELELDNIDEAMKYANKALEASLSVGEKVEIGLSRCVLARIFATKNDYDSALEYIDQSVDTLREVGDLTELARTLLVMGDIKSDAKVDKPVVVRDIYEEAWKSFKKLGMEYWQGIAEYKAGVYSCQNNNLAVGFKHLNRAEKIFTEHNDNVKVRAVSKFLQSLSDQAVALSISQENEYKIFGNLISPDEVTDLKSSNLDNILKILLNHTEGDRALLYSPDFDSAPIHSSFNMTSFQVAKFTENFNNILGEEISRSKPTLILDCRRDPFINDLFAESIEVVASIIVIPFKQSDNSISYLYLDKLSRNNALNPFSQVELNFAVGYSDIIAFKWAEIQKNKLYEDNLRLKDQLREKAAFPNIITQNPAMLDMLAQVRQVIDANISITIEGETGTGKDVLARAIHYNSNRRDKRFISVNCAALPESLLESELFGYKRGAFTGADRDKPGLFEEADGGTFFLDEIGDMPLSIQAKVLRVIEEKEIVRLGETTPRKVDVRIVSATNRDLKELMAEKGFRQDLYYRLSAMSFRLPPLRERRDDIPLLINHFLRDGGKTLNTTGMNQLINYNWPGNIRELENEVKKLSLLSADSDEISSELINSKIFAGSDKAASSRPNVNLNDDIAFDESYGLYDYLADHEKQFIIKALKEKRCVKKHAADLLNIPESTLRLKIKQYDIDLKKLKSSL